MSSLLSDSVIQVITGAQNDLWDTFARPIIINKTPRKVITITNNEIDLAGYGNQSNETITTYIPVSGVFNAMVIYNNKQTMDLFPETNININKGESFIKVKEDCRDFINNDKTENIQFDGLTFNQISTERVQNYLGFVRYVYYLQVTP